MKMSRSVYHYHSVAADQTPLRQRIREIAATRVRYGYKRIHVVLRREGWRIDHERVYRLAAPVGLATVAAAGHTDDQRVLGDGFCIESVVRRQETACADAGRCAYA
jgi:transposase InsO family protein